jgi:pimeloyl-ACP methyl ester carboxylesterase
MFDPKTSSNPIRIKQEQDFQYFEAGEGPVLMLLHGLMGTLSNWEHVVTSFSKDHKVVVPILPIYDSETKEKATLEGLLEYLERFIDYKGYSDMVLTGNSLGGHLALMYTLRHPGNVKKLILTGSSGLYENTMGNSFPRRGDYEFIRERVAYTFYQQEVVTKELVDEVYDVVQSIPKSLRIVSLARSAQKNNLSEHLHKISTPTLLIWGKNDTITPPETARQFSHLIPNSRLCYIDKCGHVPMMEQPRRFNTYMREFLSIN